MQPPPYQPPQPQNPYAYGPPPAPPKRGMSGWAIVGIVLGGGCLLLFVGGAILAVTFGRPNEKVQQMVCLSNVKQMGVASLMYAQDHDNKLPPSAQWMNKIRPYAWEGLYHCPTAAPGSNLIDPSRPYGYAMDSRTSGKSLTKMKTPENVVVLYDSTNTARNATDAGTSRANRHRKGANVSYADGHSKTVYIKTGANN